MNIKQQVQKLLLKYKQIHTKIKTAPTIPAYPSLNSHFRSPHPPPHYTPLVSAAQPSKNAIRTIKPKIVIPQKKTPRKQ